MELEFKSSRRRWRLMIGVGILLAGLAAALAYLLINQAQQQANRGGPPVQTVPAVVALRDIPALKQLDSSDIGLQQVPASFATKGVIGSVDEAVGKVAAVNILASQLITVNLLAARADAGGKFTILGPGETIAPDSPAWRAVSLSSTDQSAVAGLIQPGDTVDVILSVPVQVPETLAALGYKSDSSTKVTYQNVVVLSRATSFYVVKVPLAVAEEIAHLQTIAGVTFSLALRPIQDTRVVDASALGETTNRVIQKYGILIPTVYPPTTGPFATPPPVIAPTPPPVATPTPQAPAPSPSG
jgi:Flp pilus assembly protein CpaB